MPTLFSAKTVLFSQLYEKAAETTAELTRPWFDKTLFSCRSTVIRDYVNEAEDTWRRCQQLTSDSPSSQAQQQWLIDRLDKQLHTLVQALYRGKPPRMRSGTTDKNNAQQYAQQEKHTSDLMGLYQQLKTYKGYEVRLGDNLRVVQQQLNELSMSQSTTVRVMNEKKDTQQRLLVAQQRLQRCQKAIAAVQRAIAKLEG